jgi:hypothetical protein
MENIGHNGGPTLGDVFDEAGSILLGRSIRYHSIVGFIQSTPRTPFEAYVDLVMECHYEDGTIMNGGRRMEIKAGQLVGAISYLAARWYWTPKAVRWFLDRLEEAGLIRLITQNRGDIERGSREYLRTPNVDKGAHKGKQKGKQATIITICNYFKNHFYPLHKGHAEGQAKGQEKISELLQNAEKLNEINACNTPEGQRITPRVALNGTQKGMQKGKQPQQLSTWNNGQNSPAHEQQGQATGQAKGHALADIDNDASENSNQINGLGATDAGCNTAPLARAYNNNNNTSLHFTSLKPKNTKQHQQTSSINPARENFAAAAAADASCSFSEAQPKRDGIEEMLRSKNLTSKLIYEKLVEAGGNALSPLAIGLAQVSQPIAWLSQGCDFETDVLPTIRAVAKNFASRNSGKISSWAYFHSAVMQARDLRLAVPKASAATGGSAVPIKPPDTAPMAERVAYHIKHSYWARDLVYGRGRAKAEIEVADILAKTDKIRAEKQAKNAR